MSGQRCFFLIDGGIPEAYGTVHSSRGERLAVGSEGEGEDGSHMTLQAAQELPAGPVPEVDGSFALAGGDKLVVRGERQRGGRCLPLQGRQLLPRSRIPKDNPLIRAPGGDRQAGWGDRKRPLSRHWVSRKIRQCLA